MFKTAGITLLICFCLFIYSFALFGVLAPSNMGKIMNDIGMHEPSAMYYENAYLRDKRESDLYHTILQNIKIRNYKTAEKYALIYVAKDTNRSQDFFIKFFLQGRGHDIL